ncbi:MAG: S8 family serine peptidase, partial [Ferruginibacter sp.]|nr:S8 family serine peptidase [Chitinophagaceae bacterium]
FQGNKPEGDFYYSRGQKIELLPPGDSIGVLIRKKMNNDSLKTKFSKIGFTFVRQLSDDIVIVVPQADKKTGKKDLMTLSMNLHLKDTQLVEKAGYLTYRKEGGYPLIIPNEIIVEFNKGVAANKINELLKKFQTEILYQYESAKKQYLLRVTEKAGYDAIKTSRLFAEDSSVLYAHPNFIMVKKFLGINPVENTYFTKQWHHKNTGQVSGPGTGTIDADIDTDLAWDYTAGSPSAVIAIIDEGFDIGHPDLAPNFFYNPAEVTGGNNGTDDDVPANDYIDDKLGWNFRGCNAGDGNGCGSPVFSTSNINEAHGTAVMGMAVAAHNNIGVIGSCPGCAVIPLQAGSIVHQDKRAFEYAISRGVKIISCSWLYEETEVPEGIESVIKDAADAGITIFFAVSNTPGNKCKYPFDIASLDQVIAVARSSNKDLFYSTTAGQYNSGYGDSLDLLAPGGSNLGEVDFNTMLITTTDLVGTLGENRGNDESCGPRIEPHYFYCWEGTSFAAPLAAGVAGLILSLDNTVQPKQVQYLLQDCADKIQPSYANYSDKNGLSRSTPGNTHGYGRLNAFEAVRIAAPVSNGTNKGGLGGIDIFLRDNFLDWGNTEQPSSTRFESPRTGIGWWQSMDIKVDAPPFQLDQSGGPIDNTRDFEDLVDENPAGGVRNRVYVRIHNRGYNTAPSVLVKLHWTDACLGFPALPADFWDR